MPEKLPAATPPAPVIELPKGKLSLSPRETADVLGCSYQYVYVLLRRGEFQSFHVGRSRRILADSVTAYVQRNLVA